MEDLVNFEGFHLFWKIWSALEVSSAMQDLEDLEPKAMFSLLTPMNMLVSMLVAMLCAV